jgi:DNA-binding CsgD family transcriptional regulator
MLIERSTELADLARSLASASGGAGAVVVIEAPAGHGKSALLDVVDDRAREAGLAVRRAAHGPADRTVASGTVRALIDAPLDGPGLFHACAGQAPLALLVDDAQWADGDSLAALAHLARRARDLPLLLVVAARPSEALADLAGVRGVTVIEPGPLSAAGAAELIRRRAPGAGAELCDRLRAAAGGDLWLLGELAAGGPPSRIELRRRLGQLDDADRHAARALAVLGDVDPHRVAEVAGLSVEDLAGVRERLAAGGVDELVARGVYEEMPAAVRTRLHRAAASVLLRDGEPAAHHLLRCGPGGDPAATAALREEAAAVPPRTAVAYLERALLERAAGDDRAAILCELATAEFHAGLPAPRRRLRQALAEQPGSRRALAQLAALEVVDPHDPAVVPVEDEPLRLLARARVAIANDRIGEAERAVADLRETAGDSVPLRAAAAWAAAELALRAGRLAEAEARARNALDAGAARLVAASAAEVLALALIERGALAEAHGVAGPGAARARLLLAEGDYEAAAAEARGSDRVTLALALAHLGRLEEGAAVADEEVGVARASGAPTALALALHARTVCEPNVARRAGIAATALTVFRGPAVLVQAALQVELGAALVRIGRRVDARDGLRRALATADAAGAVPLAQRARRELVASGARPRRAALEGAAALTPRQRQICDLAVAGKSNRAIAHALFLSIKTVETHLSRAYGTLGVLDREGMIAALAR